MAYNMVDAKKFGLRMTEAILAGLAVTACQPVPTAPSQSEVYCNWNGSGTYLCPDATVDLYPAPHGKVDVLVFVGHGMPKEKVVSEHRQSPVSLPVPGKKHERIIVSNLHVRGSKRHRSFTGTVKERGRGLQPPPINPSQSTHPVA